MRARSGVTFRDALRVGEFRVLWLAELLSIGGDQLARIALAWIVFSRTSSASLTATTYALTFLPDIVGGSLLSGLADRYPRRRVLVVTDLARAVLAAVMALPGLPIPGLWVLVALLAGASGPFKGAQGALLAVVLPRDRYEPGVALRQVSTQLAQFAGFAGGGLLLTLISPSLCLVVDAATFIASAVLVVTGVRARPAAGVAAPPSSAGRPAGRGRPGVLALVFGLVALNGLTVVPEGIATPYVHGIGATAVGVGVLMAADPVGSAVGAWLSGRLRLPATPWVMVGFAAAAGLPLIVCAARPGLLVSALLWALCGALATLFVVRAVTTVPDVVPDHRRGRVFGWLSTTLNASQGLAILAGGFTADAVGPFRAVALAGALATVLAFVVALGWWIARPRPVAGAEQSTVSDVIAGQRG
jgi:MFS family permease